MSVAATTFATKLKVRAVGSGLGINDEIAAGERVKNDIDESGASDDGTLGWVSLVASALKRFVSGMVLTSNAKERCTGDIVVCRSHAPCRKRKRNDNVNNRIDGHVSDHPP